MFGNIYGKYIIFAVVTSNISLYENQRQPEAVERQA